MAGSSNKKTPMFPVYYALSNTHDVNGSCKSRTKEIKDKNSLKFCAQNLKSSAYDFMVSDQIIAISNSYQFTSRDYPLPTNLAFKS